MNIIIPYGSGNRAYAPSPKALDASGNFAAFTATATIDDYAAAFVANSGGYLQVVPKAWPAPGAVKTVTLTIAPKDAAGNPLPIFVAAFDIQGPPPPPLATHLQVPIAFAALSDNMGPSDPGTASINLS